MCSTFRYEMLKQSMDMEISTMQKRMSEATAEKSSLESSKASTQELAFKVFER